jgi:hypothetical protein
VFHGLEQPLTLDYGSLVGFRQFFATVTSEPQKMMLDSKVVESE